MTESFHKDIQIEDRRQQRRDYDSILTVLSEDTFILVYLKPSKQIDFVGRV